MAENTTRLASNENQTRMVRSAPVSHDAHIWKSQVRLRAARDGKLNGAALRALIVIIERMYGRRIESWPSYSLLTTQTGMSRRGLQGGIKRLVDRGYLRLIQYSGSSNSYRLSASDRPKATAPPESTDDPAYDSSPAQASAPPPSEKSTNQAAQDSSPEAPKGKEENRKFSHVNQLANKKWS